MRRIALVTLIATGFAAGCSSGSSSTTPADVTHPQTPVDTTTPQTPTDGSSSGGDPAGCTPACTGKQCGPDGCGGSCGGCDAGAACTAAGICQVEDLSPPTLNCAAGQQCVYTQYIAWEYQCDTSGTCVRIGVIEVYGEPWYCAYQGCHGGNSTCGDQHNVDPVTLACEACVASCYEPDGEAICHEELPDDHCQLVDFHGWPYPAPCTCR